MTKENSEDTEKDQSRAPEKIAIEGQLPMTAIDIESQKDMKSGRYHKLRSLHKWFAARPTPAARLAVLASVYPGDIDSDELLRLMQVGPKAKESGIAEYVQKKFAENRSGGTLDDHYGYPNPNTQSPTKAEIHTLQEKIKEAWGGELPTILDPTAGRGIIPFEAMRYGFDTKSNELNPVPFMIEKVGLDYSSGIGSVSPDIYEWRDKIHNKAKENIEEYYPTEESGREILNSAVTYVIDCDSCGGEIPLTTKWWLNREYGKDAVKPHYENGRVQYTHVKMDQYTGEDFDPSDGPVSRGGDAECPHCGVVSETSDIRDKLRNYEFEYQVYGVNYETESGDWGFRAGSEVDEKGMKRASERVESDFELLSFLSEPYRGGHTDRVKNYGIDEFRDMFTPRQLVVHYEYLQAYKDISEEVYEEHNTDKAEAILSILGLAGSRSVSFSSRLVQWHDARGCAGKIFSDNNYSIKRMFGDNNLSAPRRGYIARSEQIIESYEELASYDTSGTVEVSCQDAAKLTETYPEGSADVAVVDPPYYHSIIYSELSEIFYVIQKEYLSDIYPDIYSSKLPNRDDEAVANPAQFKELAKTSEKTAKQLAGESYEQKMNEIFTDTHSLLSENGVITIMFTHRDMDAWDTLTTALVEAGFSITATHPIKTEMGDRIAMQGNSSADSSILLVGRKETHSLDSSTTLWEDVKPEFYDIAEREAMKIIESPYPVSKTDLAISVYGPTLKRYAEEYPVVNKKGEDVRPRKALSEARSAVTKVLSDHFLETGGIERLDSVSRWYVLAWLIYENDTFPYDEGRQLGVAAGVDIDDVKNSTKIWRGGKEVELQKPESRVQDIVMLRDSGAENPSSRKYPVNPTDTRFTHTIDAVHSAIHVYEKEGARSAWEWLTERNMKSNDRFKIVVTALLEVLPDDNPMLGTLLNLVSGETGEYLDINIEHIDTSNFSKQTSLEEDFE